MKKIILILLAITITTGAFAQFSWGIKAGATSNTFKMDEINTGQDVLDAAGEASWGFHAGLFARFSLLGITIQPEVLYSTT